jgi:hypothetical protein
MRIIATCIFGLMLAPLAWAADVDWKMYGTASVGGDTVCFYEAMGISRTADRHLRVWTKCLLQKDLDGVDLKSDLGRKIAESTARKMLLGRPVYVPPIATVEDADFDQALVVTQYEQTANFSNIQPYAQIFYELNCSERMRRELSIHIRSNGKEDFSDKPSDWRYVPPEGSAATLLKILCR